MKTKDEIVTNHGEASEYDYKLGVVPHIDVLRYMDEYAKEVAIAFAEWTNKNEFYPFFFGEEKITVWGNDKMGKFGIEQGQTLTTEELFNKFLIEQSTVK